MSNLNLQIKYRFDRANLVDDSFKKPNYVDDKCIVHVNRLIFRNDEFINFKKRDRKSGGTSTISNVSEKACHIPQVSKTNTKLKKS